MPVRISTIEPERDPWTGRPFFRATEETCGNLSEGGAFVRTVLINAGERNGIEKGQAAVTGDGLAGRIAEVGQRSARVLLLTDINSRVPEVVGNVRDRAVMAGDNANAPELLYLGPTAKVKIGDRVNTSGQGGVFPPGLPIGVVSSVSEKGIRVKPFVDWSHMEVLRIVDYEMIGILDFEELSRLELEIVGHEIRWETFNLHIQIPRCSVVIAP